MSSPVARAEVLRVLVRADCGPLREAACIVRRVVCDTWRSDPYPCDAPCRDHGLAIDYAAWLRKANRETPLRLWPPAVCIPEPDKIQTTTAETRPLNAAPMSRLERLKACESRALEHVPRIGDRMPVAPSVESVRLRVVTRSRVLAASGRLIDVIA